MTFRTRLFLGFLLVVLLPLGLLFWGVRRETTGRLTREYQVRESALSRVITDELEDRRARVAERLESLAAGLADDNRFRLAAVAGQVEQRGWLLDWAGDAMRLAGLDMLRLEDSTGRILSSGQFRNEYDTRDTLVAPAAVQAAGRVVLARVRTGDGSRLVLVTADSLRVGDRPFRLVGGVSLDSVALARLSPDPDLLVRLLPGSVPASPGTVDLLRLPLVDELAAAPAVDTASIVLVRGGAALTSLLAGVDRWFALAGAGTLVLALLLAAALSARISRPLSELAARTAALDLERLDQPFPEGGPDEVGRLAGVLGAMAERLRAGTVRLREAERRATLGDVARQVNHDVKNGLAPIRHVLRHLGQVARTDPAGLAQVYREREGTLESSVAYLEQLARNYARLTPRLGRELCDVAAVAREAVGTAEAGGARIEADLEPGLPPVRADAVVLRRILENLLGNAVDAVGDGPGRILLGAQAGAERAAVRLTVADSGPGMTEEELERAFDDFYTTKQGGTGLGLSVVRRLVGDLGGTLRVQTSPGNGTRFEIELPAEGAAR